MSDFPRISEALARYGMGDQAVAVAWLSFDDPDSMIAAQDPGGKISPLIGFSALPMRGADLLAAVGAIDENGPRLLANYRRAFPELSAAVGAFDAGVGAMESSAPGWLFAASSLVIGMDEVDVAAALAPDPDAVEVDTFVTPGTGHYYLESARLLRSIMSYRIAGVERHVLGRSVFVSLGNFVGTAMVRLLKDWQPKAIVCAGDLFVQNRILRDQTRSALATVRVPTYFPSPDDPENSLVAEEELLSIRVGPRPD
ncbi:MAG: hypothetical protein M0Z88_05410 [Actinomycetota bacterium]|nr:hypothetical protein [Actinomycetota bacterium]